MGEKKGGKEAVKLKGGNLLPSDLRKIGNYVTEMLNVKESVFLPGKPLS